MDTDTFQQQLKAKEEALLGQLARAGTRARESRNEPLGYSQPTVDWASRSSGGHVTFQ